MTDPTKFQTAPRTFLRWAQSYIEEILHHPSPKWLKTVSRVEALIDRLGFDANKRAEVLGQNKKHIFETLIGDSVSILALIFAWRAEDKLKFSQALGELGVASLFVLKPLTGLVVVVSLALGFQRLMHKEAFKKGSLVALIGLGVNGLAPGGVFVGLIAALIAVILANRHFQTDRPIQTQVREVFLYWSGGEGQKFTRRHWQNGEKWLQHIARQIHAQLHAAIEKKFTSIS